MKPPWPPLKWILAIAAILLAAVSANLAVNSLSRLPGIALKKINITNGADQMPPETLQAVGKRAVQGNFFTVNVNSVRAEFEKVAWVRSASVRRVWPDGLEIALEEHVPLARWGKDALLNTHGEIFHAEYASELPYFSGPPGSEREVSAAYTDFRHILQEVGLAPTEILLSARRAWQLKLGNGMLLELGRVDMKQRLARFVSVAKVLPELRDRRGRADLRYPNGFALKLMGATATNKDTAKTKITK